MAETKVGGRVFRVDTIKATEAIALYAEVIGFLGPAAAQLPYILFSANQEGIEGKMITDAALLSAFGLIVKEKGAEAIKDMAVKIIAMSEIQRPSGEYSEADLDSDFDNPAEAIEVIMFVLREHLRPFIYAGGGSGIFQAMAVAFRRLNS